MIVSSTKKVILLSYHICLTNMGRYKGIEPLHAGATIRSVNHFTNAAIYIVCKMAEVVGFEPTSTVLETAALPLNYTSNTYLKIITKKGLECKTFLFFYCFLGEYNELQLKCNYVFILNKV